MTSICSDYPKIFDSRYSSLRRKLLKEKEDYIFIGANWKNGESIAANYFLELIKLIDYFGRDRTVVSFYESGSNDTTKELLKDFEEELHFMNVSNNITVSNSTRGENQLRIEHLSNVRNQILFALRETVKIRIRKPVRFLFLNGME
jgi:hypothetical protein